MVRTILGEVALNFTPRAANFMLPEGVAIDAATPASSLFGRDPDQPTGASLRQTMITRYFRHHLTLHRGP
jgi:hypothetical protein